MKCNECDLIEMRKLRDKILWNHMFYLIVGTLLILLPISLLLEKMDVISLICIGGGFIFGMGYAYIVFYFDKQYMYECETKGIKFDKL